MSRKKSEPDGAAGARSDGAGSSTSRFALPRWKKVLLGIAGLFLVSGLLLEGAQAIFSRGGSTGGDQQVASRAGDPAARSTDPLAQSLQGKASLLPQPSPPGPEGTTTAPRNPEPSGEGSGWLDEWSPALVKGGLSFFVGFSIGYALRTFLKVSAVVVGLVFLAIFALSYMGFLKMDWESFQHFFDTAFARVRAESQQFKTFVTGSLPSAGIAVAGLWTGFRRK